MTARLWLLVSVAVLAGFVVIATSHGSPAPATQAVIPSTPAPSLSLPTVKVTDAPIMQPPSTGGTTKTTSVTQTSDATTTSQSASTTAAGWHPRPVFRNRMLVAYYGTAGTGTLGVLGSAPIPQMTRELRHAAAGFAKASGRHVQIVYELIATMADNYAGADGTYSHDIPRDEVHAYLRAARRNHALLVLDLQPGRSDFLTVAKRYAWLLRQPDVGIALDPEWRMHGDDVPGKQLGWVGSDEVNAVARYVAGIARTYRLPQKLFLIHQFVPQSIYDIAGITAVKGLAMVQHVDGWGPRQSKLDTFHAVARPRQFTLGFKLFYQADVDLMTPAEVVHAVPRVRFVSYQ